MGQVKGALNVFDEILKIDAGKMSLGKLKSESVQKYGEIFKSPVSWKIPGFE